jgi:hypothetical protein
MPSTAAVMDEGITVLHKNLGILDRFRAFTLSYIVFN